MISRAKGKQAQITSYYAPEVVDRLKALSDSTRVPQSVYLREALDDLLKKYETPILTFDTVDDFYGGEARTGQGVFIWVGTPEGRRRFFLSRMLLRDQLECRKPSVEATAIKCCRDNRSRIEAACMRAYRRIVASSPTTETQIDLQAVDFD